MEEVGWRKWDGDAGEGGREERRRQVEGGREGLVWREGLWCLHEHPRAADVCVCVSGTSRQVCVGCGSCTVSRLEGFWVMRWDWVKPSRPSLSSPG